MLIIEKYNNIVQDITYASFIGRGERFRFYE